jgi:hypothetical protein
LCERYAPVFISVDHEKSQYGMGSPGPASLVGPLCNLNAVDP